MIFPCVEKSEGCKRVAPPSRFGGNAAPTLTTGVRGCLTLRKLPAGMHENSASLGEPAAIATPGAGGAYGVGSPYGDWALACLGTRTSKPRPAARMDNRIKHKPLIYWYCAGFSSNAGRFSSNGRVAPRFGFPVARLVKAYQPLIVFRSQTLASGRPFQALCRNRNRKGAYCLRGWQAVVGSDLLNLPDSGTAARRASLSKEGLPCPPPRVGGRTLAGMANRNARRLWNASRAFRLHRAYPR